MIVLIETKQKMPYSNKVKLIDVPYLDLLRGIAKTITIRIANGPNIRPKDS